MKLNVLPSLVAVCLVFGGMVSTALGQAPAPAQGTAPKEPMQAQLLRTTAGRELNAAGFASTSVPLKKGAMYDVLEQSRYNTLLSVNGHRVVVPNQDVIVSPKPQIDTAAAANAAANGFTPGTIFLVSAKYSLMGNQPTNVKNKLQRLLPTGVITAPVEIPVTDALSVAAQDEANVTQQTTIVTNGTTTAVVSRAAPPKNVLTVVYTFNGQQRTKMATEGQLLVLP